MMRRWWTAAWAVLSVILLVWGWSGHVSSRELRHHDIDTVVVLGLILLDLPWSAVLALLVTLGSWGLHTWFGITTPGGITFLVAAWLAFTAVGGIRELRAWQQQ
jgi:hypothetical protein